MNANIMKTARLGLLQARKISPTALTVVGIAGAVTATVLACRATLKLTGAVEELEENLEIAHEKDPEDVKRAQVRAYVHFAGDIVKLYGPAVLIGTGSVAAISGGHAIMLKRNAALAAALTVTEKAFAEYRDAVKDKYGEEKEREIHYDKGVERTDDTKKGVVSEEVTVKFGRSPYAVMFDKHNRNWSNSPGYNIVFLEGQMAYANQKLNAYGYLILNDVLESLGFEKTPEGAVVGWVKDGDDGFVDFGLYDFSQPSSKAFMAGEERSVILDFNVDGVVYHLIGRSKH